LSGAVRSATLSGYWRAGYAGLVLAYCRIEVPMTDLARRGVSAAKWSVSLTLARLVLQIASQAVLARILGPEIYGVFGMALVIFVFSMFLSEFGLGMFLLQRETLTDEDVRFVTTWQVLFGVAAAVVLLCAAPIVAAYFNDARVEPVLRWMSIACVLMAAAAPATRLLSRDLNFRAIGLIDLGSYAVGYLMVGVPLALAGTGVMTLVVAWLTQSAVKLVATVAVKPHAWRPLFRHSDAREVFQLGRNVFFTLLVNWFLGNVDRVVIGRYLGSHPVGLYNAGFNLSSTASSAFVSALSGTFLSSGARVKEEPERLRRAFLQILASIWVIAAPMFVLLAMLSDGIIAILYGDKWVGAGDVLRALLFAIPATLTLGMSTPVLWNTGRGHLEPLLQLPILLVAGGALLWAVDHGVVAVAWAVAATLGVRGLVAAVAACRAVRLGLADLVPQLARSLVLCSVVAFGAHLASRLGEAIDSRLVSFGLTATAPLLLLLVLVVLRPSILGAQASTMAIRVVPRLSRWLGSAPA